MSNIHEYVIFDRADVDPVLDMTWLALEDDRPGWGQWDSTKQFLTEYGLAPEHARKVDATIARKTVRQTIRLSDTPFLFLDMLLDEKRLAAGRVNIEKGNHDYANEILSCAVGGYLRGDVSLATLTAAYRLHASHVEPEEVFPPDLAEIVAGQPAPRPMLPSFPELMQEGSDGISVTDTRKFTAFMIAAWNEKWPLCAHQQKPSSRRTIRSSRIAEKIVRLVRLPLAEACMYRWFEC